MDFPIHIDSISIGLPIVYFRVHRQNFLNQIFLPLNVILVLANCAVPDEMQQYAAFHLGLHCFQALKYLEIGTCPASLKILAYMGKFLIFTRNIKIFTCPAA